MRYGSVANVGRVRKSYMPRAQNQARIVKDCTILANCHIPVTIQSRFLQTKITWVVLPEAAPLG